MKKIICIFGTRPEAVKMVPVVSELKEKKDMFGTKVLVTAQHRGMLDQVLGLFGIEPDYDLNVMQSSQSLAYITTSVLSRVQDILRKEKPDLVLVHGDTTTTFSSALAAFYEGIPAGHVEAGLRSYDKFNPYPEEVNRHLTDVLCDLHFVPTRGAKTNLLAENLKKDNIFVTGNTVIDTLLMAVKKNHRFREKGLNGIDFKRKVILVTAHRRENWGAPLTDICLALKALVRKYRDVEIVYPVHLNPSVKNTVYPVLGHIPAVHLMPPLDYIDFVNLMNKSYLILTDSGGLQEEAPSLGKPVLVLRKVTERPEAVSAGTVKVIGVSKDRIVRETSHLLDDAKTYGRMAGAVNPYGDGKARVRTVRGIMYYLGMAKKKPEEWK